MPVLLWLADDRRRSAHDTDLGRTATPRPGTTSDSLVRDSRPALERSPVHQPQRSVNGHMTNHDFPMTFSRGTSPQ